MNGDSIVDLMDDSGWLKSGFVRSLKGESLMIAVLIVLVVVVRRKEWTGYVLRRVNNCSTGMNAGRTMNLGF